MTPETLPQGELNGLHVRVVAADNPDLVGIEGRVIEETEQTLCVAADDGTKVLPKPGATFEFELDDGEHAVVEGDRLVARPARRTETAGGSKWHSD